MSDSQGSAPRDRSAWKGLTRALVLLLALDLVTKLLAYRFAPDRPVAADAPFAFRLMLNSTGVGVWASALYAGTSHETIWALAAGEVLLIPYLLAVRRLRWNAWWTFVAGLGAFGLSAPVWTRLFPSHYVGAMYLTLAAYYLFLRRVVSDMLRRVLAGYGLVCAAGLLTVGALHFGARGSVDGSALALRATTTLLALTVLWLVRRTPWRLPLLLFSAAALGNGLSLVLPPHAVIDFFYAAVLARFLHHGVMNVADLYFDASCACACALAARTGVRLVRRRLTGARRLDDDAIENEG